MSLSVSVQHEATMLDKSSHTPENTVINPTGDKQSAKHRLIKRLDLQKPSGVRDWTRDDLYAEVK